MDFALPPEADTFRTEVRALLAQALQDPAVRAAQIGGDGHEHGLHRALGERGWIAPRRPRALGGADLPGWAPVVLLEEFRRVDAPALSASTALLVASVLRQFGSAELARDLVPEFVGGRAVACVGFSEPDCGSDVASVTTRATFADGRWTISGRKMFTTFAHRADYCFLLTRTNPSVAKHRGLTVFLVPMSAPGIEVGEVRTMAGERTNLVFLDDVVVDDDHRIGEIDGGWEVMRAALVYERVGFNGFGARLLDAATSWAQTTHRDSGTRPIDEPGVRERLAMVAIHNEIARLMMFRDETNSESGIAPAEAAGNKLYSAESLNKDATDLIDLMGPSAMATGTDGSDAGEIVELLYRLSSGTTIYGGTSEVQRSIVAETALGLPRSR